MAKPTFSKPFEITNPLFPGALTQVIQLGHESTKPSRVEITRLPGTNTIEWNGQQVETVVSQLVSYLGGHIAETALDYFAQADDGSVWYFGEDVANFEAGVVANHDGTWRAGKDGPPGMIMPAQPKVGDVFRPANQPGIVFEEDTVKSIGATVDGPRGPVTGAVTITQHLADGSFEEKVFAPGYREFAASAEDELVTVALATATDALPDGVPADVESISNATGDIFDSADSDEWATASTSLRVATTAWGRYKSAEVPPLLAAQMTSALEALAGPVAAKDSAGARRAALDAGLASLDFELRYRPPADVDRARLELWAGWVQVDADAGDKDAVNGDVAALEIIWPRMNQSFAAAGVSKVTDRLGRLRGAADSGNVAASAAEIPKLYVELDALKSA